MPDRHRHRHCPWCGSDQRADWVLADIEGAGRHPDKATVPFWRTIGVKVLAVYDDVLFWQCPDCGGTWHRFWFGHDLYAAAEQYVGAPEKTKATLDEWAERMGLAAPIEAEKGQPWTSS